jgi:short-subunit dehydrogenase
MRRRDLSKARILITGASSGIGRALAIESARRGARLLLTARNKERLNAVARSCEELKALALTVEGDITCPHTRLNLVSTAEHKLGGLDILINNAGIGATGHFQHAQEDRLRTIMETNFFAPVELTRLCVPLLKASHDPALLFVNSVAGRRAIPSRSEYSASKFALMGFSEAIRAELAKDGIGVTVVNPGLTESSFEENMLENNARHSLHSQRSMSADQAAKLILNALERRVHEATFTFKAKLLLWINRFAPRFLDRKMAAFVTKLYRDEQNQISRLTFPQPEKAESAIS